MTRFLPFGSRSRVIQINSVASSAPSVTYATWNPSDKDASVTLSNGNLTSTGGQNGWANVRATIGKSTGKWYWEVTANYSVGNSDFIIGAGTIAAPIGAGNYIGIGATGWSKYTANDNPYKIHSGSFTAYGSTIENGSIVGIALDMDGGTITFYNNGVSEGVAFNDAAGTVYPMVGHDSATDNYTANFGATPFAYSVPSGYNAGLYA